MEMSAAQDCESPPANPSMNGAVVALTLAYAAIAYGPLNEARLANTKGGKALLNGGRAVEV